MKNNDKRITSIRDGNIEAFEELYETYSSSLLWFAYSFINNRSITEDIIQESFIALWQQRSTLTEEMNLKNYLMTIVRNKSISKLRSMIRMKEKSLEDFTAADYFMHRKLISLEDDASNIDMDNIKAMITDALASLPDKYREVFFMSKEEGLKNQEIAEKLNLSVKAVEKRMTKTLKLLRNTLKDNYIFLFLL